MQLSRDRARRGRRAAALVIFGAGMLLAVAWATPRSSEAVAAWLRTETVDTRMLAVTDRLAVTGSAGATPQAGTDAPSARAARATAVVTLDAGADFTMVGVTCDVPAVVGAVEVRIRTSLDGRSWSRWYEGPLERAADAEGAPRAFMDAMWTGAGRYVQVGARADDARAPLTLDGVRLMAIDTEGGDSMIDRTVAVARRVVAAIAGVSLTPPASAALAQPTLVTRKAWGADESLRRGTPATAPVKMAFVHHTTGGNTYAQADAPGLVRGIYAYHTLGLGWSDIGYNFLIDRFGTIYEGRYGGVTKGVIGAQVLGFNTGSTGISVIGTYSSESPPVAAITALEKLLAWKLGLSGLDPMGAAKMTCGSTEKFKADTTVTLPVIAGHRDANYTECPGEDLYAQLPAVRQAVAARLGKDVPASVPWAVTLTLPSTQVEVDDTVTYSGSVKTAAGAPGSGTVTVQKRRAAGGDWIEWRSAALRSDGSYAVAVTMTNRQSWELRAKMPADQANLTGYSAVRELTVGSPLPWAVTLTLPSTQVEVDDTVTYSGSVKTAAGAPGSGTVTVQKRRAAGGAWIEWRSAALRSDGSYAVAVTMTNRQSWELRAKMPADQANLTGYSAVRELTVGSPLPWAVTLTLPSTQVEVDDTVTYSGSVKTAAGAPGSGTVTVQKRRAAGGDWIEWRSAALRSDGSYAVAVTMTNRQSWELRAKMPADQANLTGYSAVRELTVAAADPALATQASSFTITGRGWGHGIGMSQWGAYGLAKHGSGYKSILQHYYSGVGFTTVRNSTVRVLLQSGLQAVKLTCSSDFTVRGSAAAVTIRGGKTATTTYVGGKYRVVAGGFSRDFTAAVTFAPTKGRLNVLTATDLKQAGQHRGTIRVVASGTSLMMINHVALESYLRGVVPHEVSPSWPVASLKAQACAARSYAERARRAASGQWDLYCDVRSQAYGGTSWENATTDAAIKATAGVVPSYGGEPIQAFYFSSSGGHTENIELAWETSPLPYLKGVDDPYDSYATLHTWGPLKRTSAQLTASLGTAVKGFLRAIYRVEAGASPRIVKAAIIGSEGTTFMHGSTLRAKIGLNSAWATFKSMSISPAAADKVAISGGQSVALSGRVYPALASGATVKLFYSRDGAWRSRSVATVRHSQDLSGGYTAKYSSYSVTLAPTQTTQCYFLSGAAKSPTTTITVR